MAELTPLGKFDYIEGPWNEAREPIREFQRQVELAIGGIPESLLSETSITIGADTDASGTNSLVFQTRGVTRAEIKNNGATYFTPGTDANLLVIDPTNNQVSIGSAPVLPPRKFYVLLEDTNTSSANGSHAAIEVRTDMQQATGTLDVNGLGLYGTLWVSGGATFTQDQSAVKGNAYIRPGAGPITKAVQGGSFRVRRESNSDITKAMGVYIDGFWDVGTSGTIDNYYGLYIEDLYPDTIAGNHVTNTWGVFQVGGASNYFKGHLTIGRAAGVQGARVEIYNITGDAPDLLRCYQSDLTTERLRVNNSGGMAVGGSAIVGQMNVLSTGTAVIGQIIKGVASQAADLLQIRNSSDVVLFSVEANGDVNIWDSGALINLQGALGGGGGSPTGAAGGVLGGTYPNPSFAADMATQAELDAVAAAAASTVVASTVTGAQNNYAPTLSSHTLIEWAGASDAAFTGIAGGSAGMLVTVKNTGTKIATFAHNSGSSSAGNKLFNLATSAPTPVAVGGYITYQHDGTQWQLVDHEQGAWITPTFAAGNFVGGGTMTWTVEAGDVTTYKYCLRGKQLFVDVGLNTTTLTGTPANTVKVTLFGFACTGQTVGTAVFGAAASGGLYQGYLVTLAAGTFVTVVQNSQANYSVTGSNNFSVQFWATFEAT